jgi:uncharacterized protein (TIGR03066 family)
LRTLETYVKEKPKASDARFVLAYHYLTMGKKEPSVNQLRQLQAQLPSDNLIKELLLTVGGPEALGPDSPKPEAKPEGAAVAAAELVGNWTSTGEKDSKFAMELGKDGSFVWTYQQGKKSQSVRGAYALDGNVLAMEPESGGVMLAELTKPQAGKFGFQLLGAPPGDPGLVFVRSKS